MRIEHIKGLLRQELFITIRSYEVILDIFVFPVMSCIVFGFLSSYLTKTAGIGVAHSLLAGMLLWQVIFIIQYSVSVGILWNIWSRNLSNMFIAPITMSEYMTALVFSGVIKASVVFLLTSLLAIYLLEFNIFSMGLTTLFLFFSNLAFFSFSFGLVILGLIFRYGTRIQAFAWGILPIFQPLTAAFYPVSVLPEPLRSISYLFPPTFIFEAMRLSLLDSRQIQWEFIWIAFFLNSIYFVLATFFFRYMFAQSKNSGQFARLEG